MTYMVRIIEEDIYRLVTREGFEETFWKTLRQWREEDPKVTQRRVFEYLNDRGAEVRLFRQFPHVQGPQEAEIMAFLTEIVKNEHLFTINQ